MGSMPLPSRGMPAVRLQSPAVRLPPDRGGPTSACGTHECGPLPWRARILSMSSLTAGRAARACDGQKMFMAMPFVNEVVLWTPSILIGLPETCLTKIRMMKVRVPQAGSIGTPVRAKFAT